MSMEPGLRTFVICFLLQVSAVVLVIGGFLWRDRKHRENKKKEGGEENAD